MLTQLQPLRHPGRLQRMADRPVAAVAVLTPTGDPVCWMTQTCTLTSLGMALTALMLRCLHPQEAWVLLQEGHVLYNLCFSWVMTSFVWHAGSLS